MEPDGSVPLCGDGRETCVALLRHSNGADGQTTYFSSDGANLSGLSFNNQLNSDGTQNNTGDTADWASGQQGVFGDTGVGETFTLNQTELDLIHALGWNYTLPQEVFLPAGGGPTDWQTPTAWVDGFMQALEERFNAPVEMFDPFKKIACDAQQLGVDVQQLASTGAVAVGLALRKAGDR